MMKTPIRSVAAIRCSNAAMEADDVGHEPGSQRRMAVFQGQAGCGQGKEGQDQPEMQESLDRVEALDAVLRLDLGRLLALEQASYQQPNEPHQRMGTEYSQGDTEEPAHEGVYAL